MKGKSFIVQGYGNVGYYASHHIVKHGGILIGVSEFDGSIYNPNGIDPDQLFEYKNKNRGIKNFPGGQNLHGDEACYKECDIFIPGAFEQSIN